MAAAVPSPSAAVPSPSSARPSPSAARPSSSAALASFSRLGSLSRRSPAYLAALLLLGTLSAGCATPGRGPRTAKGGHGGGGHDLQVELDRMMSRESGPFPKHRLELFGGLATGSYEAQAPGTPECTKDEDGDETCTLRLALGADERGDAEDIVCFIDTTPRGPFGTIIAHRLGTAGLTETPAFSVTKIGDGLAVDFVANHLEKTENGPVVGTLKVASYFNQGYSATCSDVRAGGRKTFQRVVGDFFRSLKFTPNPHRPTYMAQAYELRQGSQSNGFRYGLVEKRLNGKAGSAEVHFSFHLETDGKSWHTLDSGTVVTRDAAGVVDLYRESFSGQKGETLAVLTAKPSEDRKFRLKMERGEKSEALEATPAAPLSTELWASAELAKVARGIKPSYRYAILGVNDGEPAFRYISVSRGEAGVLLEEEESDKRNASALEASVKDELHVDTEGFVTKEVSSNVVSQRILSWGKLPTGSPAVTTPDRKAKKRTGKGDR